MTKSTPASAERWAVSARTTGGIVTAGVTLPTIELALLGIPPGFTPTEIENWLRDLAGVALETSRSDRRERPIPSLLHHALTGLLFSQTELWSHTGHPLPCAAVFVHGPEGSAFGWVGRARAVLLVNGEPHEPQWVIVRDEAGQEAMSASLPADAHVLLTLEYWPTGDTGSQAPASLDAELGVAHPEGLAPSPPLAPQPTPPPPTLSRASTTLGSALMRAGGAIPPPASPPPAPEPLPPPVEPATFATLPAQQPGLAPDPTGMRLAEGDEGQTLPSTRHPSARTFAIPQLPGPAYEEGDEPDDGLNLRRVSSMADDDEAFDDEAGQGPGTPPGEPGHPVGRWLQKLMGFAKKRAPEPSFESEPPAAPRQAPRPPVFEMPSAHRADASELAIPPLPPPGIEAPHTWERVAPGAPTPAPMAPAPPPLGATRMPTGLAAAGMGEILGATPARAPSAPGPPPAPSVEGLTAMSSATGPIVVRSPRQDRVTPQSTTPPAPPYPVLDVKPLPAGIPPGTPPSRGPIQIEREPVGADASFGIPKLPPRAAQPPPAGKSPVLSTPTTREPDVPEPPADFLERFAASMQMELPVIEPGRAQGPGTPPPAEAPPRAGPGPRPGSPPPLPSALRAAAQIPRPSVPLRPGERPGHSPGAPPDAAEPGAGHSPGSPPQAWAPRRMQPIPPVPADAPEPVTQLVPQPIELPTPVLHSPSEAAPVPVAESEMPALLRELPLGSTPDNRQADIRPGEIPDGMLVSQPSTPRPSTWHRNQWPDIDERDAGPKPIWRRPWAITTFIVLMLGIGWVVGHSQAPDNDVHATPMTRLLRTFGLGGARFTANVDTDPPGAWIAIDGKDLGRRTPSTLELLPGQHTLALSMPDLGELQLPLNGKRGQKLKISEALHGSLDVVASDPALPVQMSLDGAPAGYLPVHIAKLPPGLHELQFSGPRMQPWAQNVNVGIRKNTRLVSKPMLSPATGFVQVLAQMNDENGSAPLPGASVFVDGSLSGTTPTTIELPRGPHSLRVQFEGVTAPIQVIDLPGGNKRFATFQFGLDSDLPPLKLQGTFAKLLSEQPATVVATLDGLEADDVREAWLHVCTPDGLWSRYAMAIAPGDHGTELRVTFPTSVFKGDDKATWYLSAATKQGDDFFTDMQKSSH